VDLPYKTYKLVHGDGTHVPRKDKHAFGLTIVRYDGKPREKEIWYWWLIALPWAS
jgi:hypothetical protein